MRDTLSDKERWTISFVHAAQMIAFDRPHAPVRLDDEDADIILRASVMDRASIDAASALWINDAKVPPRLTFLPLAPLADNNAGRTLLLFAVSATKVRVPPDLLPSDRVVIVTSRMQRGATMTMEQSIRESLNVAAVEIHHRNSMMLRIPLHVMCGRMRVLSSEERAELLRGLRLPAEKLPAFATFDVASHWMGLAVGDIAAIETPSMTTGQARHFRLQR